MNLWMYIFKSLFTCGETFPRVGILYLHYSKLADPGK